MSIRFSEVGNQKREQNVLTLTPFGEKSPDLAAGMSLLSVMS